MDDYVQVMKELIQEYYSTTPEGNKIEWTTQNVFQWLKGIIPSQPVTEHDVFDVLTVLGFSKSQKIIKKKIQTLKADKKEGIPAKYEEIEVARMLVWNLYERIDD